MSWIVLNPENDAAIASGFNKADDAALWLNAAVGDAISEGSGERIVMLQRCIVAPFDPQRNS